MHQDLFWNLLAKKLSGEASEEEIKELTQLVKANPELCYSAQNIADLWKIKPIEKKQVSEKAFQKLLTAIDKSTDPSQESNDVHPEKTSKRKAYWPVFVAVFFMLVVAVILFFFNQPKQASSIANNQLQEIYTRPGTRTKVLLPDSTVVWLNAGSKLTYTQPFGVIDRKVTLTGEGYFDVVKNKKPFIIYTNGALIKVLGTVFNVRSYPAEKKIETSLVHGRVEIIMEKDPENKYVLKPDEKLTLNTDLPSPKKPGTQVQKVIAVRSTLNHIDEKTIAETSWIENKLVFDNESFEEVARRMERWYGITIEFKNEKLKGEHFTGTFEKETVWQALEAIKFSTPFHYQTLKNNVILITQ
jgi:transmembrane sensor